MKIMFVFISILVTSLFLQAQQTHLDLILKVPGVISAEKYVPENFESFPAEAVSGLTKEAYLNHVELLKNSSYEFYSIIYISDTFKVKGFIGVPRNLSAEQKLPAMVFNRGGNREFGRVLPGILLRDTRLFTNSGDYLFFTTQYRSVAGGEGKDEFGGAEVQDVVSLLKIAKQFTLTDTKNIFLGGWSRGAMMTYLTLKKQVTVNAAILVAGPTDLILSEKERPEMAEVHNALIPDIQNNRKAVLKERSANEWADQLNVPMLIIHGTKDVRVSFHHAELITENLKRFNKNFELLVYPNEDHGLINVRPDLKARVSEFLNKYKK
ncbi:prolyl oligopeptidase family serine peptidase [bacterium]|nr:prolyl oligopeptidase family serine peptidase [bacterium]